MLILHSTKRCKTAVNTVPLCNSYNKNRLKLPLKDLRDAVTHAQCCTQMSTVSVINWWSRPSTVYHTDRPQRIRDFVTMCYKNLLLPLPLPSKLTASEIWLVPTKI